MSDGILIELAPGWALGFDPHQWMIETADIRCQQAVLRYRRSPWRPVAFIGSTKTVLRRCLSEKGIELTPPKHRNTSMPCLIRSGPGIGGINVKALLFPKGRLRNGKNQRQGQV